MTRAREREGRGTRAAHGVELQSPSRVKTVNKVRTVNACCWGGVGWPHQSNAAEQLHSITVWRDEFFVFFC